MRLWLLQSCTDLFWLFESKYLQNHTVSSWEVSSNEWMPTSRFLQLLSLACMCARMDLHDSNKAIIVDRFPRPHTEDLMHHLVGATRFLT